MFAQRSNLAGAVVAAVMLLTDVFTCVLTWVFTCMLLVLGVEAVVCLHPVVPASHNSRVLRSFTFRAQHGGRHGAPNGEQHGQQDQDEDAQVFHFGRLSG